MLHLGVMSSVENFLQYRAVGGSNSKRLAIRSAGRKASCTATHSLVTAGWCTMSALVAPQSAVAAEWASTALVWSASSRTSVLYSDYFVPGTL